MCAISRRGAKGCVAKGRGVPREGNHVLLGQHFLSAQDQLLIQDAYNEDGVTNSAGECGESGELTGVRRHADGPHGQHAARPQRLRLEEHRLDRLPAGPLRSPTASEQPDGSSGSNAPR